MTDTKEMTQTDESFEDLSELVAADADSSEPQVYELGYHILPTVSEDELEKEVNAITEVLKSVNADFVGERFPAQVTLAYPIDKKIDGKREEFTSAYFGWIAFEIKGSDVHSVHDALASNENVLRFILTKTSRDQVAAVMADPGLDVGAPEPETEVEEVVGADTDGAESTDENEKDEAA